MVEVDIFKLLNRIGALVELKAKRLCPVDEGFLMAHIYHRVEGNSVIIYTDVEYAEDMEFGMPPDPAMTEDKEQAIKEWAHRVTKGQNEGLAYGVINKLKTRGSNVETGDVGTPQNPKKNFVGRYRPFLRPALHQSMPEIKVMVMEAFK